MYTTTTQLADCLHGERLREAVLGNALEGPEAATTISVRDGQLLISDGPFIETKEFIAGIDIVRCADQQQAIALAAAHPVPRDRGTTVLRPLTTPAIQRGG